MASNSTVSITYKLQGDNKSFKELVKDAEGLKKALNADAVEVKNLTGKLDPLSKKLAGAAAGFLSLSKGFEILKGAINVVKEFERANSELASVLGTTVDGISSLTEQAMELGRTTEFTAKDVTALQNSLARLGFTQGQILSMSDAVLKFATAVNTDLGSAADFTGAVLRSFGLRADQTRAMLDVLAASTTKSALSFDKLNTSMSIVAPVAAALGFGVKDVAALLGGLSNAGFDASSAATALRNIFLYLADSNSKLSKAMGGSVKDIDTLIQGLKDMYESGMDVATMLDLTDKRSVAAFATFVSGASDVKNLRRELDLANGSLEQMYSTVSDNLEGSIRSLASAWEGMQLQLKNTSGFLKEVIQELTVYINFYNDILSGKGRKQAGVNARNALFDNEVNSYIKGATSRGLKSKEDYELEYQKQSQIIAENRAILENRTFVIAQNRGKYERAINAAEKERLLILAAEEKLFSEIADIVEDVNNVSNVTSNGGGGDSKSSGKSNKSKGLTGLGLSGIKEDLEVLEALKQETDSCEESAWKSAKSLMTFFGVDTSGLDPAITMIEKLGEAIDGVNSDLQPMLDSIQNDITGDLEKKLGNVDPIESATSALSSMANVMSGLSGVVSDSAESWLSWGANVIKAIAAAIPSIVQLTAAQGAQATTNTIVATTGAASSMANIPIVGPALAVTAAATVLAAILSSISSIPKFAEGGIAFGPTLGLFGEYSGASNNPEVVAPLDKLRGMLYDGNGGSSPKTVELKARGRDLYAVLEMEGSIRRRS